MKKIILALIFPSLLLGCGVSFQYIHPSIGESTAGSQVRILREFCAGEGRGLIHFEEYNGVKTYKTLGDRTNINLLTVPSGTATVKVLYMGPDSSLFREWQNTFEFQYNFEPGKTYLVRYKRETESTVAYELKDISNYQNVSENSRLCEHEGFSDKRYWK